MNVAPLNHRWVVSKKGASLGQHFFGYNPSSYSNLGIEMEVYLRHWICRDSSSYTEYWKFKTV